MKPWHLDFHKPTHEQLQIALEKNYLAMCDMFGLFMLHEIDGSINMYTSATRDFIFIFSILWFWKIGDFFSQKFSIFF